MTHPSSDLIKRLRDKGVNIPKPESVEIDPGINPDRISGSEVTLHAGCKLFGTDTWIGAGTEIGLEAPATIDNCYVGPDVQLKGGFFSQAVFLKGATCGSCAHVRSGTILEEYASIAHSVGLKQTILFPYVTLGSLINFCDCLMAGGTDARNHSEVGSAYIHFNYTPQQDKATPSLIGDVPGGVMLDKPPIFLGGQGGLVGPCRIGYGITIAAGTIYRKDELRPHRLIFGGPDKGGNIAYAPGAYRNVKRQLTNNLVYIGNLIALGQWYRHGRCLFVSEAYPSALHEGLLSKLDQAVSERIKRLDGFFHNLTKSAGTALNSDSGHPASAPARQKQVLVEKRNEIRDLLKYYQGLETLIPADKAAEAARERFLECMRREIINTSEPVYLDVIKNLSGTVKTEGTQWLQAVVDELVQTVLKRIPEFQKSDFKNTQTEK